MVACALLGDHVNLMIESARLTEMNQVVAIQRSISVQCKAQVQRRNNTFAILIQPLDCAVGIACRITPVVGKLATLEKRVVVGCFCRDAFIEIVRLAD